MKPILILAGCAGLSISAMAQEAPSTASATLNPNATITDGNLVGVQETFDLSGLSGSLTDLQVQLNITGGLNGDLYAYLVDPQGQMAVLINRLGVDGSNPVGAADGGLNVILDSAAANNINSYGAGSYTLNGLGQVTGTWAADGRLVSPLSTGAVLAGTTSTAGLNVFLGMDSSAANGTWRLFVAGVVDGGPSATLASCSLNLTATPVPEPSALALVGLSGAILMFCGRRK